jgi:hypothetical protein
VNDLVHIGLSAKSKVPVCWVVNGPLSVERVTLKTEESTCDTCTALQQAFQELEDAASGVLMDEARIKEILGEL